MNELGPYTFMIKYIAEDGKEQVDYDTYVRVSEGKLQEKIEEYKYLYSIISAVPDNVEVSYHVNRDEEWIVL